jgi:transposase
LNWKPQPATSNSRQIAAVLALSRSTLAEWVGACGVRLQPLVEAMKEDFIAKLFW